MQIKISKKWLNHKFNCNTDYIKTVCKGRCCEGTNKILISLLPEEETQQKQIGNKVENHLLLPDPKTGKCPNKTEDGLCKLHYTDIKPFGCIISPFTINKNNTLIIRHRYSKFKCHGTGKPAYITFKDSLTKLFGEDQYNILINDINNKDDLYLKISGKTINKLKYLDNSKKTKQYYYRNI